MSKIPFMPLYVGDYLGDTQHLTTEQHGAYLLILMAMWRSGGRLPADPKVLCRIARIHPPRWPKMSAEVMAFFQASGDEITHDRLVMEIKKASHKSQSRAESGRLGGKAKALKNNKPDVANATDLPKHSSLSESEPESERKNNKRPDSAARPPEPSPAVDFLECKSAFNGSTERMLAEVQSAMGSGADRCHAEQWLAQLLRTNGPEPVSQAFQMLSTARAERKPIVRVLPWWAKTASTLKANAGNPKPPLGGRPFITTTDHVREAFAAANRKG